MKLTLDTNNIIVSGQMQESEISVGDPRVIIHHLVKSVYSNPKRTMIQEYLSNARDANVEAGNADRPVIIKMPNIFEPTFEVRDFGIGILPSRMQDIFIKIGNSTKRNNNNEDGCFGIGSKIGFAYTDQFTITTITKEDNLLIKRLYVCVRRDDYSLKLMEIGEPHIINNLDVQLDQVTGTTISIPIKKDDISSVQEAVIDMTEFWKVRPILTGMDPMITYPNRKFFYECDDFKFSFDTRDCNYSKVVAVLNGVVYPVPTEKYTDNVYHGFRGSMFINFAIGEIVPALSRESLQFNDKSIALIRKRVKDAISIVNSKINEILNKEPTYISALMKASELVRTHWLQSISDATWRNNKLIDHIKIGESNTETFVTSFEINHSNKIHHRYTNNIQLIPFGMHSSIFYTEKNSINYAAIKFHLGSTIDTPTKETCYVFNGSKEIIEKWLISNHLEEVISKLICVEKIGYVRQKGKATINRPRKVTRWKCFSKYNRVYISCDGEFDPKSTSGGFYFIIDKKENSIDIGNKTIFSTPKFVKIIGAFKSYNVYGVSANNLKFLDKEKWKPLSDLFKTNDFISKCHHTLLHDEYGESLKIYDIFSKINMQKLKNNSVFNQWAESCKIIKKYLVNYDWGFKNSVNELINNNLIPNLNKSTEFEKVLHLHKKVRSLYPLLTQLNYNPNMNDVTDYINMIDSKNNQLTLSSASI